MLIKGEKKYIKTLTELWKKVFGDNEEYIALFFDEAYGNCECFAETVDEKAVSALYLLKCDLKYNGKVYSGRYLYAAATDSDYRSKGLMAKLIEEAKIYCKEQGIEFIALVPASDSLYGYYEKFGFTESMYKYRYVIDSPCFGMPPSYSITDDSLHSLRGICKENMLFFSENVHRFAGRAMSSFSYAEFYKNKNGAYFAAECDFCTVYEFLPLCEQDEYELHPFLESGTVVYSPYECKTLENAEKIRNGMIYAVSDSLKKEDLRDIYMNIALD